MHTSSLRRAMPDMSNMPNMSGMSTMSALLASFSIVSAAALFVGCDDMGGRRMTGTKPAVNQPAANGGGRPASALGKAKGSAERVQDRVDDHNREIEKAADEIGKD